MVRIGSTPRIVWLVLVLLLSTSPWAEVCRGTKVLKTDLAQRNAGALKQVGPGVGLVVEELS